METISESFDIMLLFILNPITWAIAVAVSIWTKQYWKTALGGALSQLVCLLSFVYLAILEEGSFEEVLGDIAVGEILLVLVVGALSGVLISTLVFLFVRERWKQQAVSVST